MEQDVFDPRTTQYRPQNALLLAKASLLAYKSPEYPSNPNWRHGDFPNLPLSIEKTHRCFWLATRR